MTKPLKTPPPDEDIEKANTTMLPVASFPPLATTATPSMPLQSPDLVVKFNEAAGFIMMVVDDLKRTASLPQGVNRHFGVVQTEIIAVIEDLQTNIECLNGMARFLEGLRMVSSARPVAGRTNTTPLWMQDQPGDSFGSASQPVGPGDSQVGKRSAT